jgi:hypothetical protein
MINFVDLSMNLLFIGELGSDMVFVLKIFTLLAIFSFITQHMGKGAISVIIMLIISWFVIFDYFAFFGGIYVLYMMMALGFSGTIIDFFFVSQQSGGGEKHPGAPNAGKDVISRQNAIRRMGR